MFQPLTLAAAGPANAVRRNAVRKLAMMHLAMHDALETIAPKYARYAPPVAHAHDRGNAAAGPVAGAARAASLSAASEGARMARRVTLGETAARAVLARRGGDGWDEKGSYVFRDDAGQYRTTPDWNGFVLQPGFRHAKSFLLTSSHELRPPQAR